MSDTHGFGGGRSLTMRALSGAGKAFQSGGRPGGSRQVTHGFGYVLLGLVILLLGSGSGLGWVWDHFSWPLIKASPGLIISGLALRAWERRGRVRIDPITAVPEDIDAGTALTLIRELVLGQQEINKLKAQREDPDGLTHKQIMERRSDPAAALPPAPVKWTPPTFSDLWRGGVLRPGELLVVAHPHGVISGTPKRLKSALVVGESGSGKSTLLASLVAQAELADFAVFVGDLHSHLNESTTVRLGPLTEFLWRPVAGTEAEHLDLMRYLVNAWKCLSEGRPHELAGRNVLVVVDEWTGVVARPELCGPMGELARMAGQEGRKADWTFWAAGHQATVANTGGSKVRKSLVTRVAMACEKDEGRITLDILASDTPPDMKDLPAGTCYIRHTGQVIRGCVPWLPEETLEEVAEVLRARLQVTGARVLNGHTPAELEVTQPQQIVTTAPRQLVEDVDIEPGETPDEPLAKMRRLHMDKKMSNAEIMVECWGEKGKQWVANPGRNYTDAIRKIARASHGCTCGDPMHASYEQHLSEREKERVS